jgi:hypothetical protein
MSKTAKLALLLAAAAVLPTVWGTPAQAQCSTSPTVVTLFAGRTMNAGTVTVTNDASNLYVQYATTSPWLLTEAHLAVADSLAGIPQTKKGNPVPGHFAYSATFDPEVTSFTFTIPLGGFSTGQSLFIAAHAVVLAPDTGSGGGTQTGWGDGAGFPGANWATYFQYTVQSCGGPVE